MKKLAIYGAGGHGRVVADTASVLGWQEIIFHFRSRMGDQFMGQVVNKIRT